LGALRRSDLKIVQLYERSLRFGHKFIKLRGMRRKLDLAGFVWFLENFFPLEADRVYGCGKTMVKMVDDSGHSAWRGLMCRSPFCYHDSLVSSQRLVEYLLFKWHEVWKRLGVKPSYRYWVLTIPYQLSEVVRARGYDVFYKGAVKVYEDWLRTIRPSMKGLVLASLVCVQTWRSSEPFGVGPLSGRYGPWHIHAHGLTLNFGFDPRTGQIVQFGSMWIHPSELELLRKMWREWLEATYGEFPESVNDVDVKTRYETDGKKLRWRLSYYFRSPILDMHASILRNGSATEINREFVEDLMLNGVGPNGEERVNRAQRYHGFGLLAPVSWSPKSRFMRALGLVLANRKDFNTECSVVFCPTCGHVMEADWSETKRVELLDKDELVLLKFSPWVFRGG
jgi:hypothetical protein